MLLLALIATFLAALGALLGLPLTALIYGVAAGTWLLTVSGGLPYAIASLVLGIGAEYLGMHLESGGSSPLAQGASILVFGRILGPLVGAAAWEEALGEGFQPAALMRVVWARGARLVGVLLVLLAVALSGR